MTPTEFYETVLVPGLNKTAKIAPHLPRTRSLEVLMTSIAGEESNWTERVQISSGMAHSLFQIQENTINDIIENPASAELFVAGMDDFGMNVRTAKHLFDIMAEPKGDVLSVFLARLDLWCNPRPIPAHDLEGPLFQYYAETWRPAHANKKRWAVVFAEAIAVVPT